MDPAVSFVLALIALLISAVSAFAAFLSIWQNARHFPRPILQVELVYRPSDDGTGSWLRVEIWNDGNSDAQDVSYSLVDGRKTLTLSAMGTLAQHKRHFDRWHVSAEALSLELPGGGVLLTGPAAGLKRLALVVRWRQVPNLGKWRQKKFHPKLTTHLD